MSRADELVLIPQNDWPLLRDLYESNWPENLVGFSTIDNYIRWYQKDPEIKNLSIYSLNGNWRVDGIFLVVVCIHKLHFSTLGDKNLSHFENEI